MSLDLLTDLLRQAEIDAKNPQSRLKIIGSLPQTRYVKALYANGKALIAGCKAVAGIVEQQEELRVAIMEAINDATTNFGNTTEDAIIGERIAKRINALFGVEDPAAPRTARPNTLGVVNGGKGTH